MVEKSRRQILKDTGRTVAGFGLMAAGGTGAAAAEIDLIMTSDKAMQREVDKLSPEERNDRQKVREANTLASMTRGEWLRSAGDAAGVFGGVGLMFAGLVLLGENPEPVELKEIPTG